MGEPDSTRGIDQHVAPLLKGVSHGPSGKMAPKRFFQISQPGRWPQKMSQRRVLHTVGLIESPLVIYKHGPAEFGFGEVVAHSLLRLERHDDDADPEILQGLMRLLQLQQVSAAGKSPQVAVKNQQQP